MPGDTRRRYPPELKARAVRMYAEIRPDHESDWEAMGRVAELLGVPEMCMRVGPEPPDRRKWRVRSGEP